ncbi:cupredoxin domain-containing protein [Streptomyces sp. NPDC002537]
MATTHTVRIHNLAFDPQSLSVAVGDTVVWVNQDSDDHTTTSDNNGNTGWDSGVLHTNQSFPHTFGVAGTFRYHCAIHEFMKGTVTAP